MNEEILAKSPIPGRLPKTLLDHTKDIMRAVGLLYGTEGRPTRLARAWLRFFRLREDDYDRFLINTMASAGCHDLGKANNGFQKAVRNKGDQSIRHEHLSGLLLSLQDFKDWFIHNPLLNFDVVLSSVISHHLKVDDKGWGQQMGMRNSFRLLTDQKGFTELLDVVGGALNLPVPFRPNTPLFWSFQVNSSSFFSFTDLLESAKRRASLFEKTVRKDDDARRFLCSVKAALLAADSAGSGLVRADHDLEDWLKAAFGTALSARDIQHEVIDPRIQEIERTTKQEFSLQDFQEQASTLQERALLLAPCGSGKTLAAWHWIASRLDKRPAARVLFLYPTRATATEGFRDYVAWAPQEDAALAHGTAAYDLEEMFGNPADTRTDKDFTTEQRLYALGFWQKRLFSATADQFLAFMQNQYGPLCLLPLLVDSVIVVDEIHSFDKVMFSALTKFLKQFDVPVLCMTATLSAERRRALDECGLQRFPETLEGLDDLKEKAQHLRYRIRATSREDAERKVRQAMQEKKKVLWVTNQVRRCQEIAISMSQQLGPEAVQCYHSRFRLADRRKRHNSVIRSFQALSCPFLAVTTQVCEMSLDLDADVLITEHAPIAALIQRMGRCNRRAKPGSDKLGEVYIYPPADNLPYKLEEIQEARPFVKALDGKVLSQVGLEAAMEKHQTVQREPERFSSFLESGSYAMSYPYREGEEFTVPAVLDSDIEEWRSAVEQKRPTDGLLVPVPQRFAVSNSSLGKFLKQAPSDHYHCAYGFLDQPVANED
jgi:CRISPR-associated endonuclease/helicase Cas3